MYSYDRKLRLKNLEVFLVYKNNRTLGFLIIEDLRRALTIKDLEENENFKFFTEDELDDYKNIIKVDIISPKSLSDEDRTTFADFAHGLVEMKDYCTTMYKYTVNADLFETRDIQDNVNFYEKMLSLINSNFNISNVDLKNLMFLSQD